VVDKKYTNRLQAEIRIHQKFSPRDCINMPNRLSKPFSFPSVLEWILRRPLAIVVCFAAITLFFALQLPKLSFRTSIYDL
jgi:hypothetical protein